MTLLLLAGTHSRIARRQTPLWFAVVPLTLFALLIALTSPAAPHTGGSADLAFAAQMLALFTGAAYAAAFSDFFTTPGRLGIAELEAAMPVRSLLIRTARVVGTFASIVAPATLALVLVGVRQTLNGHALAIPTALAVSATVLLPSGLIAMSLSALLGTLLPRASGFARVGAVLLWFWIGLSTPIVPLPTLNGTVLNLVGDYVVAGWFRGDMIYQAHGLLGLRPTSAAAAISLLWQLALIIVILAVGSRLADIRTRR